MKEGTVMGYKLEASQRPFGEPTIAPLATQAWALCNVAPAAADQ
jgi:hypothetical protein